MKANFDIRSKNYVRYHKKYAGNHAHAFWDAPAQKRPSSKKYFLFFSGITTIICRSSSYEELLLINVVIPENIWFFQPNLGVLQQCGCQKPYARFLASFYMYLGSGKNPKIKNVKFLTNGASTCRDITQNRQYHLLDLKTHQKHKDFVLISGRVGDISDLGDVSAR